MSIYVYVDKSLKINLCSAGFGLSMLAIYTSDDKVIAFFIIHKAELHL